VKVEFGRLIISPLASDLPVFPVENR
jgi:hypothetical protein